MRERIATREQIEHLKRRRDRLLNTSATPREQEAILAEIRRINRTVGVLRRWLGW